MMNIFKVLSQGWRTIRVKPCFVAKIPIRISRSLNRSSRRVSLSSLAFCVAAIIPFTSRAQGALTNGWTNPGAISAAGETDTWTIAANPGDSIAMQISKLSGGAGFTPRIEVFAPDGFSLGFKSGGVAARLDIQANVVGTYTVAVSDANRTGTGT